MGVETNNIAIAISVCDLDQKKMMLRIYSFGIL